MQVCKSCGEEKPASEFTRYRMRRDGLYNWCKQCDIWKRQQRRKRKRDESYPMPAGMMQVADFAPVTYMLYYLHALTCSCKGKKSALPDISVALLIGFGLSLLLLCVYAVTHTSSFSAICLICIFQPFEVANTGSACAAVLQGGHVLCSYFDNTPVGVMLLCSMQRMSQHKQYTTILSKNVYYYIL